MTEVADRHESEEGRLYTEVRRWLATLAERGFYLPPRIVIYPYAEFEWKELQSVDKDKPETEDDPWRTKPDEPQGENKDDDYDPWKTSALWEGWKKR